MEKIFILTLVTICSFNGPVSNGMDLPSPSLKQILFEGGIGNGFQGVTDFTVKTA